MKNTLSTIFLIVICITFQSCKKACTSHVCRAAKNLGNNTYAADTSRNAQTITICGEGPVYSDDQGCATILQGASIPTGACWFCQ
jgi:hypothetical protein